MGNLLKKIRMHGALLLHRIDVSPSRPPRLITCFVASTFTNLIREHSRDQRRVSVSLQQRVLVRQLELGSH